MNPEGSLHHYRTTEEEKTEHQMFETKIDMSHDVLYMYTAAEI